MNGLLIIDKPAGLTSFDVVRQLRRSCNTRRVGHAGTLDPMATGVLPVALGYATRLLEYLMAGEKRYLATLQLGAATDTQDAEGQVTATGDWRPVTLPAVEVICQSMVGTIQQTPPMYSALKQNGTPLYKLAREGVEVHREARSVRIDSIEILRFAPPEIDLQVDCGKGTYIRTLCHDLGDRLGCGAHLTALRRTRNGLFDAAASHPLDAIVRLAAEGHPLPLLSPEQALADWPALQVQGDAVARLRNGVAPRLTEFSGTAQPGQLVRLMVAGRLAAVARFPRDSGAQAKAACELLKVFVTEI